MTDRPTHLDIQCPDCYDFDTMVKDSTGLWAVCDRCGFRMDLVRYNILHRDEYDIMIDIDRKEKARMRRRGPYRKSWSPR
jgi:hypothetical protein